MYVHYPLEQSSKSHFQLASSSTLALPPTLRKLCPSELSVVGLSFQRRFSVPSTDHGDPPPVPTPASSRPPDTPLTYPGPGWPGADRDVHWMLPDEALQPDRCGGHRLDPHMPTRERHWPAAALPGGDGESHACRGRSVPSGQSHGSRGEGSLHRVLSRRKTRPFGEGSTRVPILTRVSNAACYMIPFFYVRKLWRSRVFPVRSIR